MIIAAQGHKSPGPILDSKRVAMIAATRTLDSPAFYPNGQPYASARGRYGPRELLEDRLTTRPSVVHGTPSSAEFVYKIVREMKIRFYQPKSIKNYRLAILSLLRWFGGPPHQITGEDVREYLLYLVDARHRPPQSAITWQRYGRRLISCAVVK